jgi:hypothetical protein
MKKQYGIFMLTLVCVLALSLGAGAQSQAVLKVDVPFAFAAGNTILPAGTYSVSRASEGGLSGLRLSSFENKTSVFVIPTQFDNYSQGDVRVSFTQSGDTQVLSRIETAEGTYELPAAKTATAVARVRRHQDSPAGGTQ